jgi:transcription antitermination factor NusG
VRLSKREGRSLELLATTSPRSHTATASDYLFRGVASILPSIHWHAVCTTHRHEKRVHEQLCARNIESFLPLYHRVNHWNNGCRALVRLPLFPGYLFVKIGIRDRIRVLELPGVLRFVGTKAGPACLEDCEIDILRAGLHSQSVEPHSYLMIGQKVRVIAGPLAGLTGVLTRNKDLCKVVITVEMIQQSLAVQLSVNDLEPSS